MQLVKNDTGCKEGRNYHEEGSSRLPQNIGTHIPDYISITYPKIVILERIFQITELA
jgi:hypothetical protein